MDLDLITTCCLDILVNYVAGPLSFYGTEFHNIYKGEIENVDSSYIVACVHSTLRLLCACLITSDRA